MEVVEGFKEGYESDVLEPEMPLPAAKDDKKKPNDMSDEEDNTKENTNDSDEDFNIDNYVADNNELETTAESSSIRCLLHV